MATTRASMMVGQLKQLSPLKIAYLVSTSIDSLTGSTISVWVRPFSLAIATSASKSHSLKSNAFGPCGQIMTARTLIFSWPSPLTLKLLTIWLVTLVLIWPKKAASTRNGSMISLPASSSLLPTVTISQSFSKEASNLSSTQLLGKRPTTISHHSTGGELHLD